MKLLATRTRRMVATVLAIAAGYWVVHVLKQAWFPDPLTSLAAALQTAAFHDCAVQVQRPNPGQLVLVVRSGQEEPIHAEIFKHQLPTAVRPGELLTVGTVSGEPRPAATRVRLSMADDGRTVRQLEVMRCDQPAAAASGTEAGSLLEGCPTPVRSAHCSGAGVETPGSAAHPPRSA